MQHIVSELTGFVSTNTNTKVKTFTKRQCRATASTEGQNLGTCKILGSAPKTENTADKK